MRGTEHAMQAEDDRLQRLETMMRQLQQENAAMRQERDDARQALIIATATAAVARAAPRDNLQHAQDQEAQSQGRRAANPRSREGSSHPHEESPRQQNRGNHADLSPPRHSPHRQGAAQVTRPRADKQKEADLLGPLPVYEDTTSPFTPEIQMAEFPSRWKPLQLKQYNGKTDPEAHIRNYKQEMSYRRVGDPVLCLAFRSSLADPATNWYDALPAGSITSFKHLCTDFCANFAIGVPRIEDSCHLLALRQQPGEKLETFMNRFLTEKHRSRRPDPGVERAALIAGTFDTDVRKEFLRNPPEPSGHLLRRLHHHQQTNTRRKRYSRRPRPSSNVTTATKGRSWNRT
jgi:hypothetical protein